MGFTELILILVIVLIIFGAGKLPQLGEGVGRALKGFKKEIQHDKPPSTGDPGDSPDKAEGADAADTDEDPEVVRARIAARQERVRQRQEESGRLG